MSGFERFKTVDPVILRSFIFAVFAVLGGLGISFATNERASILAGLLTAVLALLQGSVTRPAVTPNTKVLAYISDPSRPLTSQILPGEANVPVSRASAAVASVINRNATDASGDHDI